MKPVLILDLYGTLLSISENQEKFSPLAKDRLLTKENPVIAPYIHKKLNSQKEHVGIFDDTYDFLDRVKHDYTLICMSNLSYHFIECFSVWKLDDYIRETIFSCREGVKKPQPVIYLTVKNMYPQSKIYMIGDNYHHDYLVPRTLGIEAFWLNRNKIERSIDPYHMISSLNEFTVNVNL